MTSVALAFLRHAQVPSHEGDMPLTADARGQIDAAVPKLKGLAGQGASFSFLATRTARSRQTAEALRAAIDPEAAPVEPAWGLRNPDLYLAGARVEMMSSARAIAAQFPPGAMTPEAVLAHAFFRGFLTADERIGYWLAHDDPPGEDARAVAARVLHFARSFAARPGGGRVVACVTHSPVMRALVVRGLGLPDPGEPGWVEAIELRLSGDALTYAFRDRTGTVPRADPVPV